MYMSSLPTRRATVIHIKGNLVRMTCVDCGHVWIKGLKSSIRGVGPFSEEQTKFYVRHWQNCGGCITKCPACKERRDARKLR